MTLTDITTHPLNQWHDVNDLILYAQKEGCGTIITDRIWAELVKLHQRIEELGGHNG